MAAFAGWSMNPNAPIDQRLACGEKAINFYVDRADKLEALVEDLEKTAAECVQKDGLHGEAMANAHWDIARKITAILEGVGYSDASTT
jgi:hypothetical protein